MPNPQVGSQHRLKEPLGIGVGALEEGLHVEVVEIVPAATDGAGDHSSPSVVVEFQDGNSTRRVSFPTSDFSSLWEEV